MRSTSLRSLAEPPQAEEMKKVRPPGVEPKRTFTLFLLNVEKVNCWAICGFGFFTAISVPSMMTRVVGNFE